MLYERDGVIYHHSVMNVGASVLGIEVYLILFDNVMFRNASELSESGSS